MVGQGDKYTLYRAAYGDERENFPYRKYDTEHHTGPTDAFEECRFLYFSVPTIMAQNINPNEKRTWLLGYSDSGVCVVDPNTLKALYINMGKWTDDWYEPMLL